MRTQKLQTHRPFIQKLAASIDTNAPQTLISPLLIRMTPLYLHLKCWLLIMMLAARAHSHALYLASIKAKTLTPGRLHCIPNLLPACLHCTAPCRRALSSVQPPPPRSSSRGDCCSERPAARVSGGGTQPTSQPRGGREGSCSRRGAAAGRSTLTPRGSAHGASASPVPRPSNSAQRASVATPL